LKKSVIVVAGGKGLRMNQPLPKQFISLAGKPILVHTLQAFLNYDPDLEMILVLPEDHLDHWSTLQQQHLSGEKIQLAKGGATRFQSVKSGLEKVTTGDLIAVHDAVRPLISNHVISQAFLTAAEQGSAVVSVALKESIRELVRESSVAKDRNAFRIIQTPQVFKKEWLKQSYQQEEQEYFTDDASVVEAAGFPIRLTEGEYSNIKITTPEDLKIAQALLGAV
jgi:2-C-methyl-D-erythritol 4-phosphate cytidylyltransferase